MATDLDRVLAADPQAALGAFPYPSAPAAPELIAPPRGLGWRTVDASLTALAGALLLAAALVAVLALFGTRPRIELSDSMRPVLRSGDVMWVHRIAAHEARAGDVVAFHDPARDRTVVHRVHHIHRDAAGRLVFETRGDANQASERWRVPANGTLGRYTGLRVPAVGHAVAKLRGLPLAVVAALSCLVLAGLAVRRIWRR